MEGDLTWGGEHAIQYIDDVLQDCAPKTCIMLLSSVTPIDSIKKEIYDYQVVIKINLCIIIHLKLLK